MSGAPKPDVGPDHFAAVDMRVGQVTAVEPFPEARNPSWKVTADFGSLGTKSTSAQVTNYDRDELLGRLIVGAINLGTRRIAGFRSEFLLIGAVNAEGVVRLLAPDPGATPGEPIA